MLCPVCESGNVVRNGSIRNGKQKHMRGECGRQSAGNPCAGRISVETKSPAGRLLREKIPPAGIAGDAGVSGRRLRNYVNGKYGNVPKKVTVKEKGKGKRTSGGRMRRDAVFCRKQGKQSPDMSGERHRHGRDCRGPHRKP